MAATMIKIELPVVGTGGEVLIDDASRVRRCLRERKQSGGVDKEDMEFMNGLGPELICYAETLKAIINRPSGGNGMDFEQMQRVRSIHEAVDSAVDDGHVLVSQDDFKYITKMLDIPYWNVYMKNTFDFLVNVKNSAVVTVKEDGGVEAA